MGASIAVLCAFWAVRPGYITAQIMDQVAGQILVSLHSGVTAHSGTHGGAQRCTTPPAWSGRRTIIRRRDVASLAPARSPGLAAPAESLASRAESLAACGLAGVTAGAHPGSVRHVAARHRRPGALPFARLARATPQATPLAEVRGPLRPSGRALGIGRPEGGAEPARHVAPAARGLRAGRGPA